MKKALKTFIKSALSGFDLKVSRCRRGEITGIDLFSDLRELIPKTAPLCLDVGANQGQTINALQKSLRNPCIHAFEPSSKIFKMLQGQNLGPKIVLHNYGLGAINQEAEFINYQSSVLSSFLSIDRSEDNRFRVVPEERRELVRISTVDDFLSDHQIREVDLLKTDTQGFDLEVLRGAEQTLSASRISYVLAELNFVKMYAHQATPTDVIDFLAQHGLYLIDFYEKIRRSNTIAWCTALFGRR